jgi:hypothetical protein
VSTAAREIVAGRLSDFDLPTLLHTFSVSRQVMALEVLAPSGAVAGRVVLKGGKVVAATAGHATGTEALRKIMSSSAQARFRVFNEGAALTDNVVPLGSVDELVERPGASPRSSGDARVRMMEGSLAEFDIASVMQAVCIGRQYTELNVLGPYQEPIGTICLKAGRVVSAKAGTIEGMAAIHQLLDTPKNYQFAVYRNTADVPAEEPLGPVGEVLLRAQKSAPKARLVRRTEAAEQAMSLASNGVSDARGHFPDENEPPTAQRAVVTDPGRVRIMEGALSDFDVPSLLQVANLGRQQVLLEVLDGDRPVGAIAVKAGMVLRANAGHLQGTAAVARLVLSPVHFSFVMSRLAEALDNVDPVGSLDSVLLRAATSSELAANVDLPPRTSETTGRPPSPGPIASWRPMLEASAPATEERLAEKPQASPASPRGRRRAWLAVPVAAAILVSGIAALLVLHGPGAAAPPPIVVAQATPPATVAAPTALPTKAPLAQVAAAPTALPTKAPLAQVAAPLAPAVAAAAPTASAPAPADHAPVLPARAPLNPADVSGAQALLKKLGQDPGPIDGILGPRTAAAIRGFQKAERLTIDGTLNAETRAALTRD